MRRKTKDKDLARRAKSLVRKWKQLIDEQNGPSSGSLNGEGLAGPPPGGTHYEQNHTGGLGSKSVSPVNSRPGTPSSGKSNISPNLSGRASAVGSRPGTPLSHQSHVSSPRLSSRPATPGAHEQNSNNSNSGIGVGPKGGTTATPSSQPPSTTPSASQLSKTNVANKRKRRNDDSPGDLVQERKKHIASISDKPSDIFSTKQNSESSSSRSKLRNANSESVLNGAVPGLHSHASKHSVQRLDANSNTCDSKSRDMVSSSKSYPTPTATLSTPGSRQISPQTSTYSKPTNNNSKQYSKSISPPIPTRRNASVPARLEGDRLSAQDKLLPKTPKVRTTAELIKDMSASKGLKVGSQTATKIVLNQIPKEKDDINTPVVPAGAKPRFRRKPGTLPPVSGHTLIQTKSEMMEKFLQSQSPQHPVEDVEGIPGFRESPPLSNPTFSENQEEYKEVNEDVTSEDAMLGKMPDKVTFFIGDDTVQQQSSMTVNTSQLSSSDPNAATNISNMSESELWSLLPPLNLAEIDWTSDDYPEVQHTHVTEERVASLDNQDQLPGVTGQRDIDNEWHDWTQTHSMPSYDGDLIHILPYVNIDD